MRNLNLLDQFRDWEWERRWAGGAGDAFAGCFKIASRIDGGTLRIIAATGEGWDHVSVSRSKRCPNWPEMEQVKHLFFQDDETAMQLHVPPNQHISVHPNCLHIWRPIGQAIPMPPSWMVGVKTQETA